MPESLEISPHHIWGNFQDRNGKEICYSIAINNENIELAHVYAMFSRTSEGGGGVEVGPG